MSVRRGCAFCDQEAGPVGFKHVVYCDDHYMAAWEFMRGLVPPWDSPRARQVPSEEHGNIVLRLEGEVFLRDLRETRAWAEAGRERGDAA